MSRAEENRVYSTDDLNGNWEFKIVRACISTFRSLQNLKALVDEGKRAGWERLEVLDDSRVRFKRPASDRNKDALRPPEV